MRAILLLVAATALGAQSPDEILARARQKIVGALDQLPDYTCVQTLDRDYFERTIPWRTCAGQGSDQEASKLRRSTADRFRLDVMVTTSGREIYSWAGARQFDAASLKQIVASGAVSTGSFGPFLINIFGQKGVEFAEGGSEVIDGSTLLKFTYRVPREASRYDFQSAGASRFIPYDGAFWIEPVSADLARLEVHTASMPHETGTCEATTSVDFHRATIGARDYLLPLASRVEISALPGHYVNTISYSGCREYRSESVIRFGGGEAGATPVPAAPTGNRGRIPRGLPLVLALDSAIDTRTAAAGDVVRALVVSDAVDKKSKRVIASAGAIAEGRIVRLEHQWTAPAQFLIAIEWQSLAQNGPAVPFSAVLDPASNSFTVNASDLAKPAAAFKPRNLQGSRALIFYTTDESYIVPRGYKSSWITR